MKKLRHKRGKVTSPASYKDEIEEPGLEHCGSRVHTYNYFTLFDCLKKLCFLEEKLRLLKIQWLALSRVTSCFITSNDLCL